MPHCFELPSLQSRGFLLVEQWVLPAASCTAACVLPQRTFSPIHRLCPPEDPIAGRSPVQLTLQPFGLQPSCLWCLCLLAPLWAAASHKSVLGVCSD